MLALAGYARKPGVSEREGTDMSSENGTTRRELIGSVLVGLAAAVVAAARPENAGALEVTYYFLPG